MADLSNVKEGDIIAYPTLWMGWGVEDVPKVDYILYTVGRITRTQVICKDIKFLKASGKRIGGTDSFSSAIPASEELITEHRKQVRIKNTWGTARKVAEGLRDALRKNTVPPVQQEKLIELFGHLLEEPK